MKRSAPVAITTAFEASFSSKALIAAQDTSCPDRTSRIVAAPIVAFAMSSRALMAMSSSFVVSLGGFVIPVLHRLVGAVDGRARVENSEGYSRRLDPQLLICPPHEKGGRMMALLRRALARFEWIMVGEFLGAASLFALLFGGLFIGHGMGLK